jgi:hypothetical protein
MAGFELLGPSDIVLTEDDFPELTDEELDRQALAADPFEVLPADVMPLFDLDDRGGMLPGWYMPVPVAHSNRRAKRAVVALLVVALLLVVASGLCITYGALTLA